MSAPCWCDKPCHRDPCPSRDHWLEVEDSALTDSEWRQVMQARSTRWDQ